MKALLTWIELLAGPYEALGDYTVADFADPMHLNPRGQHTLAIAAQLRPQLD